MIKKKSSSSKTVALYLSHDMIEKLSLIGEGNRSSGVKVIFDAYIKRISFKEERMTLMRTIENQSESIKNLSAKTSIITGSNHFELGE